jgi:hypothetical protein
MKIITFLFAILLSTSNKAQSLFVDSATGSIIAGAKYIKTLNKYIVKTDSAVFRKQYKKAKIEKEKIDTSANLFYDKNTPIQVFGNDYSGDYVLKASEFLTKKNKNFTGRKIKVLILDTGIDTFMVPVPKWFDNTNYITNGLPGRGKHGTQVSSIIQSKIGLANGVEMYHIKVFNTDIHGNEVSFTTESNLVAAAQFAIDSAIDIVGMSFAISNMPNFNIMMDSLFANNAILVASTGNTGSLRSMSYPANYKKVVALNAVSAIDAAAFYNTLTSDGKGVSAAIGGVNQWAINLNNGNYPNTILIAGRSGTSLSTPSFISILACKLEELRSSRADNYRVLRHVLNQCYGSSVTFGNGKATF